MLDVILAIDSALLQRIVALPHPGWLNWVMATASFAGIGGAVWLAWGAVLKIAGEIRGQDLVRLALAIALVHLTIDVVLKPWIDRPRPPLAIPGLEVSVNVPETRSFPSGHAANAIAAALVLTRVWPRMRRLVWVIATMVAVARVYLGIHYPLDALAGALTGLMCASAVLWLQLPFRNPVSEDREP